MPTFNQTTDFGARTAYGDQLDKDINRYREDLETSSGEAEVIKTQIGEEQSAIIKRNNQKYSDNLDQYRKDIDTINDDYTASIEARRSQADDLVSRQEDAAGLEANIAAAKGTGGKLAVSQLTSLSKDITNQFTTSINNAMKDNINFQSDLDTKLADMGFSVLDKKRVLDEFQKVLTDEEAAPLLDAIAEKYKTREGFMGALSDTIKGINEKQIGDSSGAIQRSERLERDEAAFGSMTNEQKARDIRDRFGATWNVLTASQKQQIINDTVNGTQSYRETLDMIKNLKSQSETNIVERQQMIASDQGGLAEDIYAESTIDPYNKLGTTSGDRNYTGKTTASTDNPEPENRDPIKAKTEYSKPDQAMGIGTVAPKKTPSKTATNPNIDGGYKIGNVTYTSKADYDMLKGQAIKLKELQTKDPEAFKRAIDIIKKKYIIS